MHANVPGVGKVLGLAIVVVFIKLSFNPPPLHPRWNDAEGLFMNLCLAGDQRIDSYRIVAIALQGTKTG